MKRRHTSVLLRALIPAALLIALTATLVSAGGPVCPPPMCGPQPCPPPMCGPQPCPPPMCGPAMYPPPACPPPCPPRRCEDNPLAMILKGTVRLVAGAVALPFKMVDCVVNEICRPKRCYPARPACPPPAMCPPAPMCAPPGCMPPACGPMPAYYGPPPGMGYGAPMPAPVGFGRGASYRSKPMAKKKSLPSQLLAAPSESVFGAYW